MSDIVLSASVRQNLLSLQSTADLLSTTQNRLATGKKVNTALDNPTNYFTAASLDNRASDISNLLDGIGNGVQVLQAANTGITSLQKLVDSAKSVANQALQATVGYSTKSSISTTISGATADNLLGTGTGYTDATYTGGAATGVTAAVSAAPGSEVSTQAFTLGNTNPAALTSKLDGTATGIDLSALNGKSITVGTQTITFDNAASATATVGNTTTIGLSSTTTSTLGDVLDAITTAAGGGTSSIDTGGIVTLNTSSSNDITIGGTDAAAFLTAFGFASGSITHTPSASAGTSALAAGTLLSGTATSSQNAVSTAFASGDTISVNNKTIAFFDSTNSESAGSAADTTYIDIGTQTVGDVLDAIDTITGGTAHSINGTSGAVTLHTGTASNLSITSTNQAALQALGLGTGSGVTTARGGSAPGLDGKTLHFDAIGNGTAVDITFGTTGVKTLNDLNAKLSANNLLATIDSAGKITITTTNDAASQAIGAVTGTATDTGEAFNGVSGATTAGTGGAPTQDAAALATRANLVAQYNNILDQITSTSQDASFNGVNLLNGDQLKLTFNETGKSTLKIQGVTFDSAGLGLSSLTSGTDFLDNSSANTVIANLDKASSTLRTEASALGSNLSIVQIRQDFSKNLINVLQTGSSNLTLADTNEEAANSQALSTRQSIAVSALALANQSQQSVLQLLR